MPILDFHPLNTEKSEQFPKQNSSSECACIRLYIFLLDCWVRQHFKSVCGRIFAILLVLLLLLVNVNYGLRSMGIISTLYFS